MKNLKNTKSNLLTSILFLILGILLFSDPGIIVKFITYVLGGIFILMGISKFISYSKTNKEMNINNSSDLVLAIVSCVIGIAIIFCSSAIEFASRLVMGGYILYSGIVKLMKAINLKELKSSIWIYVLITSILMIICGLYIILNSNLIFKTVGLFIIVYSIFEIILYIIEPKNLNPDVIK